MNNKGFINIVLIVAIVAIIAVGGYFIVNKKSATNNQPSFNSTANSVGIQDEAREKYADAQKKYQNDLYELSVSKWPDLKPIIEINRDLQVALVDSRSMKFYYLLEHNPSKIVRNQGVSTFANFDWTDADNKILRDTNPAFATLDDRIKELRASNDGHPIWPEFRDRFKSLSNDKEYLNITNSLNQTITEVEQLLRK